MSIDTLDKFISKSNNSINRIELINVFSLFLSSFTKMNTYIKIIVTVIVNKKNFFKKFVHSFFIFKSYIEH